MTLGKEHEAETFTQIGSPRKEGDAKLIEELCQCLHDLSQPMTVLLCALQYGGGVDSMAEMKEMIEVSQRACERLRGTMAEMREKVRDAMEETGEGREHELESVEIRNRRSRPDPGLKEASFRFAVGN